MSEWPVRSARRFRVTGIVQGVGFRRYVMRWGRRLDLSGWVRNEPDGSVLVVARGPEEALDRLARLLHGGPPGAEVAVVEAETEVGPVPAGLFMIRR